jgi:hypothetical protein
LAGFFTAGFAPARVTGFFAGGLRPTAAAFFPCTFAIQVPLPVALKK